MIIDRYFLPVGSIIADVTVKDIRNLHIGVYPPEGRVRVAAPAAMNRAAVHGALVVRLPWIKRQIVAFAHQPREGPREYRAGESHWFMGRRYRLRIAKNHRNSAVEVRGTYLDVAVRGDYTPKKVARSLERWRREQLRGRAQRLVEHWSGILGVDVAKVGIKRMHTRWGSCAAPAKRIWLNLALSRTPLKCLEYVVVHELVHFLVRAHDSNFTDILDRHLPDWRGSRAMLSELPYAPLE
jgi:predicted metal-dependent hydrolase